MKFVQTSLPGAYVIELEKRSDERGFFARSFCVDELSSIGFDKTIVQANVSYNKHKGTLRGLHFQEAPFAETKIVRCTKGRVYDVIVDMRNDSQTYKKWFGIELSETNHKALFVPEGFAHGYVTLTEGAEVFYLVTALYNKDAERGIRYDDPAIGIQWPVVVEHVSEKDKKWPYIS